MRITRQASSSLAGGEESQTDDRPSSRKSLPPSATEEEAKSRFVTALTEGIDVAQKRGHGRERASAELLTEIADGCSPDEDEVGNIVLFFAWGMGG